MCIAGFYDKTVLKVLNCYNDLKRKCVQIKKKKAGSNSLPNWREEFKVVSALVVVAEENKKSIRGVYVGIRNK